MAEEKNCPLKFLATTEQKRDWIGWHCDKKICAWWNEKAKECAITALSKLGDKITQEVHIEEKVDLAISEKDFLAGKKGKNKK